MARIPFLFVLLLKYAHGLVQNGMSVLYDGDALHDPEGLVVNMAGTILYIAESGSGEITALDTDTLELAVLKDGLNRPEGLALNQEESRLYISTSNGPDLLSLDLNTLVLTTLYDGIELSKPKGIVVNSADTILYVADDKFNDGKVFSFDLTTSTLIQVAAVEDPNGLALNQAETLLYIAQESNHQLAILNLVTLQVQEVTHNPGSKDLILSIDEQSLYVTVYSGNPKVHSFDLLSFNYTVLHSETFPDNYYVFYGLALDKLGTSLFVGLNYQLDPTFGQIRRYTLATTCLDTDGSLTPKDCTAVGFPKRAAYNRTFCNWPGLPDCDDSLTCCTKCNSGFYPDEAWDAVTNKNACIECQGGQDYVCDSGAYRNGTRCDGFTELDTQTCSTCMNQGINYTCYYGEYLSGRLCDGLSTVDTQTCALCDNSNNQLEYVCGLGEYKDGYPCYGFETQDTQTCRSCSNGGKSYGTFSCPQGQFKGAICSGDDYLDTQVCLSCGNTVNSVYTCPPGDFISGQICPGTTYEDLQTCQVCSNGGTDYTCDVGWYKDGSPCTGGGTDDTQSCAPCGNGGANYVCDNLSVRGTACDGTVRFFFDDL